MERLKDYFYTLTSEMRKETVEPVAQLLAVLILFRLVGFPHSFWLLVWVKIFRVRVFLFFGREQRGVQNFGTLLGKILFCVMWIHLFCPFDVYILTWIPLIDFFSFWQVTFWKVLGIVTSVLKRNFCFQIVCDSYRRSRNASSYSNADILSL